MKIKTKATLQLRKKKKVTKIARESKHVEVTIGIWKLNKSVNLDDEENACTFKQEIATLKIMMITVPQQMKTREI